MAFIYPLPTTRASDQLVTQRILGQLRNDQLDLLRLQDQLATGRRIASPSDDSAGSQRAMRIQSLLERKSQVRTNLETNQSFLTATDSALSRMSGLLADIRGSALSVSDSVATPTQREAAAQEVDRAIQQLADVGNQKFRERYLFAGSRTTVRPFELTPTGVLYQGNETALYSNSDIDVAFATNTDGNQVFGAISDAVEGVVDLNPVLSQNTKLADLRNGQGIKSGSIFISDGTHDSVVDISSAETLGDLAAMIEAKPPQGRQLRVEINARGLTVSIDSAGGGNFSIRDVAGGTTAAELGIVRETGLGSAPVVGADLNPRVTLTTSLDDLLGVRAKALVQPSGLKNDLLITARERGAEFNNVTVRFVDGGAGAFGNEAAVYDDSLPAAKTLTVTIASGQSSADAVLAAINAEGTFTAELDRHEFDNDGSGTIVATASDALATGQTAGGEGQEFDRTSGLLVRLGTTQYEIRFSQAKNVQDLINLVNGAADGLLLEINGQGTGLNLRSTLSGPEFSIGENGGQTASQLGIRSLHGQTKLEELNLGRGVDLVDGAEFIITRKDGVELAVDLSGAVTVQDVLDRINNHADNVPPLNAVIAELVPTGNGIRLRTEDSTSSGTLRVTRRNRSNAASDLGLVAETSDQSAPATVSGTSTFITGRDVNPQEPKGIFQALWKMRQALRDDDTLGIQQSIEILDDSYLGLNFARAELGARQQSLDVLAERLDNEELNLRESLSTELDADLAETISTLQARQVAFQASLQLIGQLSRLTLLDFL